jgi:predicted dehydrogenase
VPAPMSLKVDKTIQKLLTSDYCGDLLAINVRVGGSFLAEQSPLHWRQNSDYSGINIMSLGIWYETVMRWVGEAKEVSAKGKVFAKTRPDAEGKLRAVRIPEHVDVSAEMACGAMMNMQVSAVTGLAGGTEIWIFGKEGTILFKDDGLFGGKKGDKKLSQIAIKPKDEGRWRVEEEFINAIRGKEEVKLTRFEDGVKYMEFTEAVFRSVEDGKTRYL